MLNLISELNEEDLAAESDAEDYTASTDSNLSSCSESAGKINQMPNIITPEFLERAVLFLLMLLLHTSTFIGVYSLEQQLELSSVPNEFPAINLYMLFCVSISNQWQSYTFTVLLLLVCLIEDKLHLWFCSVHSERNYYYFELYLSSLCIYTSL